jgi:plastocyanin
MTKRSLGYLFLNFFLLLFVTNAFAEIRDVTVGAGGNLVFAPNDLTINVGDTVRWTWAFSFHSTTSTTVQNGCNPSGIWDSGIKNQGILSSLHSMMWVTFLTNAHLIAQWE